MTDEARARLLERNNRLLTDIVKKAQAVCPGSVAFVGLAGSFCSGDYHEKSDLDPLIVINDDDGWRAASCFILDDVAHDFYCTYWGQLEEMAEYGNPYVTKLLSLDMFWYADKKHLERYMELRRRVTEKLALPLDREDIGKCEKHLDSAMRAFAGVTLAQDIGECRLAALTMLYYVEFVEYMLNKSYVKRGVKRIPEEICALDSLPENFSENYLAVFRADTIVDMKLSSAALLKSVRAQLEAEKLKLFPRKPITADALSGSYEEIYSNWRNKMQQCARNGDVYLSVMSAASCQQVYNELAGEYDIPRIDLMTGITTDTVSNAAAFDRAMDEQLALYRKTGAPVRSYGSIEEFERDYLRGIE